MSLKRNKTYHSVIRFAGKRAAIRMLAPDIENSRAKKLLCTHQLEISGPHKVFFVDFDRKLMGRAFTCSTAIFFQSVASARQEGELRLGDYGHGESQAR